MLLISPHLKECAIWRLETWLLLQLPKKTLITTENKSLVENYVKMGMGASLGAKLSPLLVSLTHLRPLDLGFGCDATRGNANLINPLIVSCSEI